MRRRGWRAGWLGCIAVVGLVGCSPEREGRGADDGGRSQAQTDQSDVSKAPVELVVYYPFADDSAESFQEQYWSLVQRKYPQFRLTWFNTKTMALNDLAASKTDVDLIFSNGNHASQFAEMGYTTDLREWIDTYKYDVSRIDPIARDVVTKASNGKLTALPIYMNINLLFYNKDVFDTFGVSYPVNGMTWDDTYQLAKKLTRRHQGVDYIGFSHHFPSGNMLWLNSYGQEEIDPQTGRVTFDRGRWPDMMRNFVRFYELPGSAYLTGQASLQAFAVEQRLAMQITFSNRVMGKPEQVPPRWDIASHPVYADMPGVGSGVEPLYLYMSATSQHKKEAFLAMTAFLTEEAQHALAQRGLLPVIQMPDLKKVFAQVNSLEGKQVDALLYNRAAPALTMSQDALAVRPMISTATSDIMTGKADINTALRQAAEKGNQKLEERRAAGLSR